jgi:hypothetical protein
MVGAAAATAAVWWLPATAWAHGVGGRQDLPVPLRYFVVGAALVLVLSFAALAVLWPQPRLQRLSAGRPLRLPGWRVVRGVLGAAGIAGLALVVAAGFFGADDAGRSPGPVLVFIVWWLVLPFFSALVGDVYRWASPWRWLGRSEEAGTEERGWWPAAVVILAFTWLELVAPDNGPRVLAAAALVYTAYLALTASGSDGFAAYNRLFGGIAPLTMEEQPTWRGWLRGLPHLAERPGLVALVVVMIGSVSFDGAGATPWWDTNVTPLLDGVFGGLGRTARPLAAGTAGLLGACLLVGLAYLGASWAAARLGGAGTARSVARRFAHTLVPIAFAYAFAHYFTLVMFEGQLLLSTLSDPFGRGWDLFGTAGRAIDYTLLSPAAVWWVQVAAIVGGHLAGVVLAHDRALADFSGERAVRSQYAMLALMVLLTGLGLAILAAG